MPLLETLPLGPGTAQWPLWSTTARLVATDPGALPVARRVVEDVTRRVEAACSRFRPDSEIAMLPGDGTPARVSPLLAELVRTALLAARRTDGDVDPTLGAALAAAGYDRDFSLLGDGPLRTFLAAPEPAWRRVQLDGDVLTVPAGTRLDLGATAKAWAADHSAAEVARACGSGVLVALGGDIATAGPAPVDGWQVLVRDQAEDPAAPVTLGAGGALATSSTVSRTWENGGGKGRGRTAHHVLDPRSGMPVAAVWRTVSVAAGTCVEANTLTTAAVVRGLDALPWLRALGVPARLVGATFKILTLGDWPSS
ncbi:FAD:protein FMN transferase [Pseudonocardia sp.]|jgi:thiamine biosynthesis lipoprotein|uniref:FAD:protein FMN transferase n=1 Tax=Pseudonocardia sp. TaxID=60912 RepID=UPI0026160D0C|nr:FAD:protein FMN transferase [Pseudonocardia sp.]MCW2720653.1 FAD:protein transferase [Pseudonocardia sp.]MDT7617209.1 FAD:protein transferase [Pseudonocardiales bacterium]